MGIDLSKYPTKSLAELRNELVTLALTCQKNIGNAPTITGYLAELDAAKKIVGMSDEAFCTDMKKNSVVKKGYDFFFNNMYYQIKACRPSGRTNSKITRIPSIKNCEWDILIWIEYDEYFNIKEAYKIEIEEFKRAMDIEKGSIRISVKIFKKLFKKFECYNKTKK